jgi:hypothetical protein
LAIVHPYSKQIWDYYENNDTPEDYPPTSTKIVNWKCDNNHKYKMAIYHKFRFPQLKCPLCKGSSGELLVSAVLNKLGISFQREQKLYNMNRYYDFLFTFGEYNWIIEYDGMQHFVEIDRFHKNSDDFKYKQEIDKIKTYVACKLGYKFIRLDYTLDTEQLVKEHIDKALGEKSHIYYSNHELYQWLSQGTINIQNLLKEAPEFYQHCNVDN